MCTIPDSPAETSFRPLTREEIDAAIRRAVAAAPHVTGYILDYDQGTVKLFLRSGQSVTFRLADFPLSKPVTSDPERASIAAALEKLLETRVPDYLRQKP